MVSYRMIRIDLKQIKQLEADLAALNRVGVHIAHRNTLNVAAFQARTEAKINIEKKMITRNKFTSRSVLVNRATRAAPFSVVGSTLSYMKTQEFGGIKRSKGKHGTPIATGYASGEGDTKTPRKRLPRAPNTLRRIKLKRGARKGNRKQRNAAAIRIAAKSSSKMVYLKTNKTEGIFKVLGGGGKPRKRGGKAKTRLRMVWSLKHKTVTIPRNPWLRPAAVKVGKRLPEIHKKSLDFQFARLKSFNR